MSFDMMMRVVKMPHGRPSANGSSPSLKINGYSVMRQWVIRVISAECVEAVYSL